MPKDDTEPVLNRCRTRPANANAHPGRVVMETLAVRRKQEDIQAEKEACEARRQKKERRKADEQDAVIDVADFENQMALDDMNDEAGIPRHLTKCKYSGPSKNKV